MFRPDTLQVALEQIHEQICRIGAKYAAGCINFLENNMQLYIPVSVSPNWRFIANSYGILPAAVQPGIHLLLNNLNIVDPEILWYALSTLYSSDSWGSQQSKERIITNADLVQPGKSYLAVPTAKFNWWTSENSYAIASIEAPLKSAAWQSKFVIFHTCAIFFEIFLLHCVGLAVLVHLHPVDRGVSQYRYF